MNYLIWSALLLFCLETFADIEPSHRKSDQTRHQTSLKRPVENAKKDHSDVLQPAQDKLTAYLKSQKKGLDKAVVDQLRPLMRHLDDPKKLLEALNALFFENQLSVSAEGEGIEQEVFGKQLAEFPTEVRHLLVKAYTEGQKEYRDQLISKISESLSEMNDLKAIQLSQALLKAKEKHLEAYDRVIKNIPETDGKDSWCFTCNPTGEIGKGSGYTFEKAMDKAISEVMKSLSFEQNSPQKKPKPQPQRSPNPQAPSQSPSTQLSPTESRTRKAIANPTITGSRAGSARGRFESYMNILRGDPKLSDKTLRTFLKAGPYANNNSTYRSRIDRMSREALLKAVSIFLDGAGPYNHCPSCNLGAGNRIR